MKKYLFFFILLIFSTTLLSQIIIKGKVMDVAKNPLEGAAVYFNNTMVGTTTNNKGEFSLKVKEGQHELIVSFLGFKRINYLLDTKKKEKRLLFLLEEEQNMLAEIIIGKTKYNERWKYNLATFKKEFIGTTKLSNSCEILNPKALHFNYDAKQNILTAIAKKPLKIKHKGLGYLITYDLVSFTRSGSYVSYLGYSRYEKIKGGKSKQKRWKKNRLLSYNGSIVHFYKSVISNQLKEEGYIVDLFKRIINKERPTEEAIKKARQLVKLSTNSINFFKKINVPKNALDSALVLLKKVKLPKYKDILYRKNIAFNEVISIKNNTIYLDFDNNLNVIYTKEKEEQGFILRMPFSKRRAVAHQKSYVIPKKSGIIIDKQGLLNNPLDVYYEGYWSYEKFGNSLPLDYKPTLIKQ
jgi:hypothetical protein